MKLKAFLFLMIVCLPCVADDMEKSIEHAKETGIEAIETVVELGSEDYVVSIKSHEDGEEYYRMDEQIMLKSNSSPVYRLQCRSERFATIVVQKDWSPKILIEPNLAFNVVLTPIEEGGWELATYGGDPEFLEVYIVTSESVAPASAERYMEHLALARGSAAAFQSIGDSLLEGVEDHAEEIGGFSYS